MADLLPARIEPLGDSAQQGADSRREKPPQPKAASTPAPAPPALEPEQDDAHQLDELA